MRESAVHWNSLKPSAHPPGLRVRSVREQVEGRNTSRRRQSSAHKREQSASRANLCSIFKAANCESTQRAYARRTPHRARISAQFEALSKPHRIKNLLARNVTNCAQKRQALDSPRLSMARRIRSNLSLWDWSVHLNFSFDLVRSLRLRALQTGNV